MRRTMKAVTLMFAAALAAVMVIGSCKRDPIVYPKSNYYLVIKTDKEARDTVPQTPKVYAANFYNPATGRLVLNTYIHPNAHPKDMPEGGYVDGLTPGEYDLLVYAFDDNVITENEGNSEKIYAQTKESARSNGTPIVNDPAGIRRNTMFEMAYIAFSAIQPRCGASCV